MMLWILLGIVIGVILTWHFEGYFSSFCILAGFAGFIMGAVCWLAIGGIIGSTLPTEWECIENYEICAFKDNSAIEGEKFLFSGHIGENYEYRFIKNTPQGKIVDSINAEDFKDRYGCRAREVYCSGYCFCREERRKEENCH